jgi:hypothetical protein
MRPFVPPEPFDAALAARVKAVCGLESVRPSEGLAPGGQRMFEQDLTGVVVLLGEGYVSFADATGAALYPENRGKWLRFEVLRPYFEDGEVWFGGTPDRRTKRTHPSDGESGIYRLPSGRRCFRRDIPEDLVGAAHPDGHYKDVLMSGRSGLSLYDAHPKLRESNRRLRALLAHVVGVVEQTPMVRQSSLQLPETFVTCPRNARFLRGDVGDVAAVCELQADITRTGRWVIPGLESCMTARTDATIRDVGPQHITVEWANGSGEVLRPPLAAIAAEIRGRIPVRVAAGNLTVVPTVRKDERIDGGTCLWGGAVVDPFADAQALMRALPKDVNDIQRMQALRAWSLLASGQKYDGRVLYPIKYVVPQREDDVYFRAGVQRIVLRQDVSKAMRAEPEFGVHMDFFTTSQRAASWRRLREKRERAKITRASEGTESAPQ